ncbi:hypothetical protein ACTXT7_013250 [Hymenolepis weldensis]
MLILTELNDLGKHYAFMIQGSKILDILASFALMKVKKKTGIKVPPDNLQLLFCQERRNIGKNDGRLRHHLRELLISRNFFSIVTEKFFPDTHKATTTMKKINAASLNLPSNPSEAAAIIKHEGLDTGMPRLGQYPRLRVNIKESIELKNTVDRLIKHGKWALLIGTSSWKEQFVDAITVNAGDGDDLEAIGEGEVKMPSCKDYVMHFLTVFWKVLFAFVPPTDSESPYYAGGWVCFFVSIVMIGFMTAIIGDLASAFGCTIGLTDAVTSTTFVALGTSLPGKLKAII